MHFPAYVRDLGLSASVGAGAHSGRSVQRLFKLILGSFASGAAGQRWSKKCGLSTIYASRALAITALMLLPKTAVVIYLFAAVMGVLWLSTVPLTTGIVGQASSGYATSPPCSAWSSSATSSGSFLGVWLGGWLFDTTGSYDGVWWAGVALGLAAAVIHLPIDERPLVRQSAPAPAGTATY